MTEVRQIYKCGICGNIVEVLHSGKGQLVCCGQPMELLVAKEEDTGREKHVPVIEKTSEGYLVKVGSVEHPMLEEHYIEWIELHQGPKVLRKFLQPGEKPEALFQVEGEPDMAREYCNIHGLWKSK